MMHEVYDVIIVGGGPAGLAAAIYARRAGKSALVLEKNGFGGQIAWSPRVENYPGVGAISGAELSDRMFSQALELGAEAELTEVTGLSAENGVWTVESTDGSYRGKTVILATGAKHRKLGIEREDE
ncbi:MAG TPA: FAD-dependent oxidoreductase, partial [Candidatus Scatomorpha intestinavium]|nr:FAD-dependent oxidoreductase [Candidatus Scatomorpha intestinavium]